MANGNGLTYSPEYDAWYAPDDNPYTALGGDTDPTAKVGWGTQLGQILTGLGTAASGIIRTTQGVYTDAYGRLWKNGQLVTNYAPTGTLGGLFAGLSLTSLLIIGVVIYLVLRK